MASQKKLQNWRDRAKRAQSALEILLASHEILRQWAPTDPNHKLAATSAEAVLAEYKAMQQ